MDEDFQGRKYNKISYQARVTLLNKITLEGKSIKQASLQTGINYSTAKTILMFFRKKLRTQRHPKSTPFFVASASSSSSPFEQCSYRQNDSGDQSLVQVVSIGGKEEILYKQSGYAYGKGSLIEIVSTTSDEGYI